MLLQLSSGFAAAHKQDVIHRDIKPSNILINSSGDVKIVDCGIAAATNGFEVTLTKTGAIIGSPAYLSPDRADGLKAAVTSIPWALLPISQTSLDPNLPKPVFTVVDLLLFEHQG